MSESKSLAALTLFTHGWRLTSPPMKRWLPFVKNDPFVAVIRLSGVIASGSRGALNDAVLAGLIEKAFARGKPAAIALLLNSPGGSPVQSSLIAARIRRLADEKNVKVYAFVEDVAASRATGWPALLTRFSLMKALSLDPLV